MTRLNLKEKMVRNKELIQKQATAEAPSVLNVSAAPTPSFLAQQESQEFYVPGKTKNEKLPVVVDRFPAGPYLFANAPASNYRMPSYTRNSYLNYAEKPTLSFWQKFCCASQ